MSKKQDKKNVTFLYSSDEQKDKDSKQDIKQSADKLLIPASLLPENISETLDGKKPASRWKAVRNVGAAAVVLLVVVTAVLIKQNSVPVETVKTTSEAEQSAAADQSETAVGQLEGIYTPSDFQALYDVILKNRDNSVYGIDGTFTTREEMSADAAYSGAIASQTEASSAAGTGASYAETNVRTEGVDEADILKNDGTYLYILRSTGTIEIVKADTLSLETSIPKENLNDAVREIYVDADRLVVIADTVSSEFASEEDADTYRIEDTTETRVYTYDIKDKTSPKLLGTTKQEGSYLSSRKMGNYMYVFTSFYPAYDEGSDTVHPFAPRVNGSYIDTTSIYLPEYIQDTSYLVISSFSIEEPEKTIDTKAVLSGTQLFYVSDANMYVANTKYTSDTVATQILRFSLTKGKISPEAVGNAEGVLNDSFSIDEYDGYLRIVTTSWDSESYNNLFVLDMDLNTVGSITGLAKGETIESARFMEDTGYFVTFRQVDPLFSVDLSDPLHPKVIGELKITGFSEYLHFYEDDLLLGIGWEVDAQTGENIGLKLSMFDISDPSDVREISKMVLKDVTYCSGLFNYKAVLMDPEQNIVGLTFMKYDSAEGVNKNYYGVFSYKDQEFSNDFLYNISEEDTRTDVYYTIDSVRGTYIDSMFYLVYGDQVLQFDREQNFEKTKER
ncbi:MAG: beta-propeller domain-containing protein [Lachnospiraceae bacterium]